MFDTGGLYGLDKEGLTASVRTKCESRRIIRITYVGVVNKPKEQPYPFMLQIRRHHPDSKPTAQVDEAETDGIIIGAIAGDGSIASWSQAKLRFRNITIVLW